MLLPILLLVILLSLSNAKRAQLKGLSPMPWVFFTVLAFFVGLFTAAFVLVIIMMVRYPQLMELAQLQDQVRTKQYMEAYFTNNTLTYSALMMAGGFGGYLLIRYIIDKKQAAE